MTNICNINGAKLPIITIAAPKQRPRELSLEERVIRQAKAIHGRSRGPISSDTWRIAIVDQIEIMWGVPAPVVRDTLEHADCAALMNASDCDNFLLEMGFALQSSLRRERIRATAHYFWLGAEAEALHGCA